MDKKNSNKIKIQTTCNQNRKLKFSILTVLFFVKDLDQKNQLNAMRLIEFKYQRYKNLGLYATDFFFNIA